MTSPKPCAAGGGSDGPPLLDDVALVVLYGTLAFAAGATAEAMSAGCVP